jgi:chromosome segregation ATPase
MTPLPDALLWLSHLTPLLISVIAVFGGVGFWSWKTKKIEASVARDASMMKHFVDNENRHQDELSGRLTLLLEKIEELNESRIALIREVAQLRTQLRSAKEQITKLTNLLQK